MFDWEEVRLMQKSDEYIREHLFKTFAKDIENVKQLFNTMNDGLLITNNKLEIIAINPAFQKITGYNFHEVYRKTPKMFQSGKTARSVFEEMWNSLNGKGSWTGELINKRKNGEEFYSFITITHIKKEPIDDSYYIGIMRDITERKQVEETISYLAYYDQLTHLPNRTAFSRELRDRIEKASKTGEKIAILFFDIDRFKNVNDTLGHQAGDELLVKIANRLTVFFEGKAVVSRFGGDEFCLLIHSIHSKKEVYQLTEQMIEQFSKPFEVFGKKIYVTTSIGLSFFPEHGTDAQTLIKHADIAMFRSKNESRHNYSEYDVSMNKGATERLQLENELYEAIDKNQFEIFYQLQMDTKSNRPYGVEALIRWKHPEKGTLSPAHFLGVAEETGLIPHIDEWVIRTACKKIKEWHDKGLQDLMLSVNISQQLFDRKDFVQVITNILNETRLNPTKLCIEITEHTAIIDMVRAIDQLRELRQLGVKISLDDFGTGYSSLSQLRSFPLDVIKIDQSFVRGLKHEQESEAIIKLIIAMAKNLNFSVICEGVETKPQQQFIQEVGCNYMQGYLFSKPVPDQECEKIMFNLVK